MPIIVISSKLLENVDIHETLAWILNAEKTSPTEKDVVMEACDAK